MLAPPRLLLGLICLVVAVALLYGRVADTIVDAAPKKVAQHFLDAVLDGDLAMAQSLSTSRLEQAGQPLRKMRSVAAYISDVREQTDTSALAVGRLADSDESLGVHVVLLRVDDRWLVDDVRLLTDAPEPEPTDLAPLEAIDGVDVGTFSEQ